MRKPVKKISPKSLKKVVERCLVRGPRWYRPQGDPAEQPTWKDVYQLTLNAYVMALEDVLKAFNGDPSELERTCPVDPHRKSGRPFVLNPSTWPWRQRAAGAPAAPQPSVAVPTPAATAPAPPTPSVAPPAPLPTKLSSDS
jgi:hypothetical protein